MTTPFPAPTASEPLRFTIATWEPFERWLRIGVRNFWLAPGVSVRTARDLPIHALEPREGGFLDDRFGEGARRGHELVPSMNHSASFNRSSPEMSWGSSTSRIGARVRDSRRHSSVRLRRLSAEPRLSDRPEVGSQSGQNAVR
jgi:hypothetical protein